MLPRVDIGKISKPIQIAAIVVLFIGELTFSKTQIYSPYGVFFIIVLAFFRIYGIESKR
jgi:hypothetical protein